MQSLTTQNQQLMEENRDNFSIIKDLLIAKEQGKNEFEMKRIQYERETTERKQWLKFAPPLINSIFGREIFPQSLEDTALIESIADTLSAEQIEMLAGSNMFPPQVWGPLAARMSKFMKEKEEEAQMVKRLAESAEKDPEADAAGDAIVVTGKEVGVSN